MVQQLLDGQRPLLVILCELPWPIVQNPGQGRVPFRCPFWVPPQRFNLVLSVHASAPASPHNGTGCPPPTVACLMYSADLIFL